MEKLIEKEKKTKSKEQLKLDKLIDKFGQEAIDASIKAYKENCPGEPLNIGVIRDKAKKYNAAKKKAEKNKSASMDDIYYPLAVTFLNQFGESRDPYEYEVEKLHQYVEVCNYSVEEIKLAMADIVKELPGPSFNAIGHYVNRCREAGNTDEKHTYLEDVGDVKDTDEERIEDSLFCEKISEILDEKIPSLWDSNKLVIDDIDGFLRGDAKATNLELIVGSGKTFMVPFIAAAGNKQGLRFVYCTHNKSLIRQAMDGMLEFSDMYRPGKEMLYIPSIEDSYRHFFGIYEKSKAKTNFGEQDVEKIEEQKIIKMYLPRVTKADRDSIKAVLYNRGVKLKDERVRESAINAWENVENALINIDELSKAKYLSEANRKAVQNQFTEQEGYIKRFFNALCTEKYKTNYEEMITDIPALVKLYPGCGFKKAKAVFMTFHKTEKSLVIFGKYGTDPFVRPSSPDFPRDNLVYFDESDRFCSSVIGAKIEEAVKCPVSLYEFVYKWFTWINKHRKHNKENDEFTYILPKDMEVIGEEGLTHLKQAYIQVEHFFDKYCLENHDAMRYNPKENSDPSFIPSLASVANRMYSVFNNGKYNKEDDKNTVKQWVVIPSDVTDIDILEKNSVLTENYFFLKDFVKDALACTRQILSLIRYISLTMHNKKPGSTHLSTVRSVANRFDYEGDTIDFIANNMLPTKSQSISYEDDYSIGLNLITFHNAEDHSLRTVVNAVFLSNLPDYDVANMVFNHDKVIFSSGTASLNSLHNIDQRYVEEAVNRKYLELNKENVPDVFYELSNLKKAVSMSNETRKKKLEKSKLIFPVYEREVPKIPTDIDSIVKGYDVTTYESVTGQKFPQTFIKIDRKGCVANGYEISRLAFTTYAIDQMLQNECKVGLIFQNALPSDKSNYVYSIHNIKEAAKHIVEKYTAKTGKEVEVKVLKASVNTIEKAKKMLKDIDENTIVLLVTAYNSIGAGVDLSYNKLLSDVLYDIDAVFLDKISNVIKGSNEAVSGIKYQKAACTTLYDLLKFDHLVNRDIYCNDRIQKEIPHILGCVRRGDQRFVRNLYPEDSHSPYHETIAALLLQAFGRIDRGKKKASTVLIAASATLIFDGGLSRDLYCNSNIPYMFERFLENAEQYASEHFTEEVPDKGKFLVTEKYQRANRKNCRDVWNLLDCMQKSKNNGEDVPDYVISDYNSLRASAFTMGYQDNGLTPYGYFADMPREFANDGWRLTIKNGDTDNLYNAFISICDAYKDIPHGSEFLKELEAYKKHRMFGKGWERLFENILKHEDEVRENGFKFIPFAETYYIFLGEFYERITLAMSLPGGAFDVGRRLVPVPANQFEDFDFRYEGTNVFVDTKGYRHERTPVTSEKLKTKEGRCPGPSAIVFENVKPSERKLGGDETILAGRGEAFFINGALSYKDSVTEITERNNTRRNELLRLCEKYKIKE